MKRDIVAMAIALALCLPFAVGGCVGYVEPGVGVYAPAPVVEVDPFPFVWIGPGYYGGRYYYAHPGHGRFHGGGFHGGGPRRHR